MKTFPEAPPLTDVDRESAIDLLRFTRPMVLNGIDPRDPLRDNAQWLWSNLYRHAKQPLAVRRMGEPELLAIAPGLLVTHQGRAGVLTWEEIAHEFN